MHVIRLDENRIRLVHGQMVDELKIDWTIEDHAELRRLIEFALNYEELLPSLKKAKYKKLKIHEGANHIDIEDDGVGTLNLLIIEDHMVARK